MKKKILTISLIIILINLIWLSNFSEIQAENQSEIDKAIDYLKLQPSDSWITMALVAAGKTDSDLNYLKTLNGSSATDYEKIILAITAAGENPKTFGNVDFVAQLESFYQNNQIGSADYLNDDFWGILALVSAGKDPSSQIIQDSQNFILTNQNPDGGWSYAISGQGVISDIDDTAAAIMALLETGISPDDPVITKATDYLKSSQNPDGGFPFGGGWGSDSNASSDSWVISAIYKLGQNPSDWSKSGKNPIDNLKFLQMSDGSFDVGYPDSTAYAVIALSQKSYPINRFVPNTDATLSSLTIDGTPVAGFASSTLSYNDVLPIGTITIPNVAATTTDPNATEVVNQATSVTGSATVVVTAQDGLTKQTYIVAFSVVPAPVVSSGGGGRVYTINASADEHGLIAPSGLVSVGFGSDRSFTITPDTGYHIADVLVDGSSVGAVTSYTFNSVAADHTISASFTINTVQTTTKIGDITGDNVINEYDFVVLMADWGQTGTSAADLNHDGTVNEYDFALLMLNWGL